VLVIVAAEPDDFAAVLSIYNEVIRTSTAVYTEEEYDDVRGRAWFDGKRSGGNPLLVAREAGEVVGFASFGDFRPWPCYRHSVEHSVHVRADCRGRGIGRALVLALMQLAAAHGKHVMIAGIDAENSVSIGLHQSLGFRSVGRLREVGFKFGRWLDLEFLQCILPTTTTAR
jgi:phosphinothricin acetyltransferase